MNGQAHMGAGVLPTRSATSGAVLAMTLCAAVLIASEFMPVSLLTPVAADLGMTEGQAGQAISVSGLFAVLTSLFVSAAVGRTDRRTVLLAFTLLMVVSGTVVAFAPTYAVLMAGRALLGVAIGGFWSMSTATVMRLVPREQVPKALAILNGGNALAATVAAPLGSFLGAYIGWRGAFFCVIPLAALTFFWQLATLPPLPAGRQSGAGAAFRLLRRPQVAAGMLAILFLFMGQFALFTYLRPFLETVTRVDVSALSLILLLIGVTGLLGTWLVGWFLRMSLYGVLVAIPLGMAAIAVGLIAAGHWLVASAALLAGWGLIGTPAPVGWGTWLTRTLPEEAEAGGGLMVATIQLAITLGASAGGLLLDTSGFRSTFGVSAALLSASALLALLCWRWNRRLADATSSSSSFVTQS
jgi:predicted MFS family arabinose efflux permease